MKYRILILAFSFFAALLFADNWGYVYKQTGIATYNGIPIKNDTIYFYLFPNKNSKSAILTDSNGKYEVDVEVSGYCMSGSRKCPPNISDDDCYYSWSREINSDSLTFSYKGITVKTKNHYLSILKAQRTKTLKDNVRYTVNIRF